jgi:Mn2+/Fe2+ NRAMP family transporter
VTRLIAIIPAVIVIALYGDSGTRPLIILSQVVLSLQLPFAVFPLVMFTSDPPQDGRVRQPAVGEGARVGRSRLSLRRLNVYLALPDVHRRRGG